MGLPSTHPVDFDNNEARLSCARIEPARSTPTPPLVQRTMATQYKGFTGDQLPQIQRAHMQMATAVQFALDTAFHRTGVFTTAMDKYFGGRGKHQSAVMAVLNSMMIAIRAGSYDLLMGKDEGGTLGLANTKGSAIGGYAKREGRGGVTKFDRPYVDVALTGNKPGRQKERMNITVTPLFFTLPFRAKDKDSQVETLVHELSHHAANTNDEKVLGITCYGMLGVKAARFAGKAANNAENYGYFVESL